MIPKVEPVLTEGIAVTLLYRATATFIGMEQGLGLAVQQSEQVTCELMRGRR